MKGRVDQLQKEIEKIIDESDFLSSQENLPMKMSEIISIRSTASDTVVVLVKQTRLSLPLYRFDLMLCPKGPKAGRDSYPKWG